MGLRGELFSTRFSVDDGQLTYFFNVKENRNNDVYLNIVESKKTDTSFKRFSILIFPEALDMFVVQLERVVKSIKNNNYLEQTSFTTRDEKRIYEFQIKQRQKTILRILERKADLTNKCDSIIIPIINLDQFMDQLHNTLHFMSDHERK